jgi:hypothetical protein
MCSLTNIFPQEKEQAMTRKQPMLEPLMASLLTLDWEISSQTIRTFEQELEAVRKKVGDDHYSKKLIDLALPICNYLRVRKGLAAPSSMQFLHQAVRTLYSLRQKQKLGATEGRERVRKLVNNFRDLMAEVKRVNATLERATTGKPAPATRKIPAGKKGRKKKVAVRKTRKESPKVEVLKTIRSHKQGIDIATLIKISGFADSTVRGIVYRAVKLGTNKRVRRGFYVAA